jgi:hypothetical protein
MASLRDKCKRSLGGTAVRPADRRDNVTREGDDLWPRRECPEWWDWELELNPHSLMVSGWATGASPRSTSGECSTEQQSSPDRKCEPRFAAKVRGHAAR